MVKAVMEEVSCSLCGRDDFSELYSGPLKRSSRGGQREGKIVKCGECGLVYLNPRMKRVLSDSYYLEDESLVSGVKELERSFERVVKWIETFAVPGRILSVGAGGGSFLHVARERGWQVHGVESNEWLCYWAKKRYGLFIQSGTIDCLRYPDGYFDVVVLWDVIGKVSDPGGLLKKCGRLLKQDGFVYVNYPDYGSKIARVMKSRWVFLLSDYLYYFTRLSIKKLLDKNGFQTMNYQTHWQFFSLGYLVYRVSSYSKFLYKLCNKSVEFLRMVELPVKSQLGQTGVIARKK